ncbi:MAG: two-component system response regulator [Candidatus Methylomirabilales bacterium]
MRGRPMLVIDDDLGSRETVREILAGQNFDVCSASGGPAGIDIARAAQPAAIFIGMGVSGGDGISRCALLKQDPILRSIPLVGITDSPDLRYTQRAFGAGVEFFLSNPFSEAGLVAVAELALELAQRGTPMHRRCHHPRFPVEVPVRCLLRDAEATRKVVGQTGNMSLGGLLLLLPGRVPARSVFRFQLRLPDATVTAEGAHVWQKPQPCCDGRTRHGVRLLRFVEDVGLVRYRHYLSQVAAARAPMRQPAA